MAQVSVDPDETDLEQRILRVLKEAGSPMKAAQLAKECQVPKKKLNQVLYQMMPKAQVVLTDRATWRLGEVGAGELVPTEPAQLSLERPRQDIVAIPQKPGSQLSQQQEQIYGFLRARGPCKALVIAQFLGKKTAKDVNPDLYDMRKSHLLDLDPNSKAWAVYQPEGPAERSQPSTVIYQKNPVMIYQNGPNNHISIENSEAVQIGHWNSIVQQTAPWDSADASPQDPLAGSWGSQNIHIDRSVLKRVQMGHGNKMTLQTDQTTAPGHSPSASSLSVSPPVSATTAGPESSFDIRMPTLEPHPEGKEDMAQKIHIKSCLLEDAAIGNSNRMRVSLGTAGQGRGAGPEDSSGDLGEPAEDTAPQPEAAKPRDKVAPDAGRADPDVATLLSPLETVALESKDSEAAADGP
ncbi:Z-DNA-binding protein 1 isoform 2-T2 [Molossus nigricans]